MVQFDFVCSCERIVYIVRNWSSIWGGQSGGQKMITAAHKNMLRQASSSIRYYYLRGVDSSAPFGTCFYCGEGQTKGQRAPATLPYTKAHSAFRARGRGPCR